MTTQLPLSELSLVFARVKSMLLTADTATAAVDLLAEAAKTTIPAAIGAGVTIITDSGAQDSAGSTDRVVREADDLQYTTGQGPCLSAWGALKPMRIDDVSTDLRWPQWSDAVSELPIRSVVSVPMEHEGKAVGALKVYSAKNNAFTDETERVLTLFAGPAATLLAHVQTENLPAQLSQSLQESLYSRDMINLGKGILMSRHGVDAEHAMSDLVAMARRESRTLFQCAEAIVASTQNEHNQ